MQWCRCKIANKFLKLHERVEVVGKEYRWVPPFLCCPVARRCPWKETQIKTKTEKTREMNFVTTEPQLRWMFFSSNSLIRIYFPAKTYVILSYQIYVYLKAWYQKSDTSLENLSDVFRGGYTMRFLSRKELSNCLPVRNAECHSWVHWRPCCKQLELLWTLPCNSCLGLTKGGI